MSLRTGLAAVRRQLGEPAAACIAASRTTVGIEDGPGIWVDAREFDRLLAAGRGDQALALCRGDLLSDLDDDWVLEARQAHRERVAALLGALGAAAERPAISIWRWSARRERLALDPLSEDAARVLIARLARTGDRASAVAVYRGAARESCGASCGIAPLAGDPRPGAGDPGGAGGIDGPTRRRALPAALCPRARTRWSAATDSSAGCTRAGEASGGRAGDGDGRRRGRRRQDTADRAFAVEARDGGAAVLAGRCSEDGAAPYAPFAEALRGHATARPPRTGWPPSSRGCCPSSRRGLRARKVIRAARATGFRGGGLHVARPPAAGRSCWSSRTSTGPTPSTLLHAGPRSARRRRRAPLLVVGSFRPEAAVALDALLSDARRDLPPGASWCSPGLSARRGR